MSEHESRLVDQGDNKGEQTLQGERILVTGGAGYLGAHMCLSLLERGAEVLVLDNLSNGSPEALRRVGKRSQASSRLSFVEGDIRDEELLTRLMRDHHTEAVVHFAGLKAVGESVAQPLAYYDNNVGGTLSLLRAMQACGVWRMVFSSSATVYGVPESLPINEYAPLRVTNPYGQTKLIIEEVLRDLARADERWRLTLLRYFNPVGAHPSGELGEDPHGTPNNLAPYITQVALGLRPHLSVFGGDYPTHDGTGVRDYLHVLDLIEGHIAALEAQRGVRGEVALEALKGEARAYNLGVGRGVSVLELVRAFEEASGRSVPYEVVERRAGDVASCYADPTRAAQELGWRARRGVEEMAQDAWRWQHNNPHGYRERSYDRDDNPHTKHQREVSS
jgi:UDP-glucose 4-epimerase